MEHSINKDDRGGTFHQPHHPDCVSNIKYADRLNTRCTCRELEDWGKPEWAKFYPKMWEWCLQLKYKRIYFNLKQQ